MRIDLNLKYRNSWNQFEQDIKRAQAILHEPFSIGKYPSLQPTSSPTT